MKGLHNFLVYLNQNWTMLVAIATLLFALYIKIKKTVHKWKEMNEEEKQKEIQRQIEIAKKAISNYILSLVAAAEVNWEGSKLGSIKRAQVIEKIYKEYPILLEVVDQEELLKFIDEHINEALVIVREKLRREE